MADATSNSIEVILVRMEGKIDRQADRIARYENDTTLIRQRLHDLSNEIAPVIMLNLQDRIRVADKLNADVEARLTAIENIEQRRLGAASLVKVLWGIMGAVGVGGVAAVVRVFQVGHL